MIQQPAQKGPGRKIIKSSNGCSVTSVMHGITVNAPMPVVLFLTCLNVITVDIINDSNNQDVVIERNWNKLYVFSVLFRPHTSLHDT